MEAVFKFHADAERGVATSRAAVRRTVELAKAVSWGDALDHASATIGAALEAKRDGGPAGQEPVLETDNISDCVLWISRQTENNAEQSGSDYNLIDRDLDSDIPRATSFL